MRTIIVGAGSTGLFTAIALARRGWEVVLVDRDPGPGRHGSWHRKGVMQFHHAHTFRGPVVELLRAEMPDALEDLRSAGASIPTERDGRPVALLCRRATFDTVLRHRAVREPGIALVTGRVDGLLSERGRVVGVTLPGRALAADLVIDASGRAGRFIGGHRAPAECGDCGAVYVDRLYQFYDRFDDGVPPAPTNSPIGLSLNLSGYFAIAFLHDAGTFSITFAHDGSDHRLRALRSEEAFSAAVRAIPGLADWTDPRYARPIAPPLPGGRLYDSYRGQLDATGVPATPGLVSVGDAVCTTTPLAGRGVTLALRQALALVRSLEEHGGDTDVATIQFDQWCTHNVRPWFDDHRRCDADRIRRWAGHDVDVTQRLPSDLVVAAAAVDDAVRAAVAPYARMDALPASLDVVEPRARELFAAGWRPQVPVGPTRADLAELCTAHVVESPSWANSRRPAVA